MGCFASGSSRRHGTRTLRSTNKPWLPASASRRQRAHRLLAGVDVVALLRDHARCRRGGKATSRVDPRRTNNTVCRADGGGDGAWIHASLYERAEDEGLGYKTAICVAPGGEVLARTRKVHIPAFPGYHEDRYFRPGDSGCPVVPVGPARFGFPPCWDQWFPEQARAYSLAGADVLVYPSAIGSEVNLPDFDTQPIWEHVITANGVMNVTFMVVINRVGHEGPLRFYGSSFISDPYGRVLARAPRDEPAMLVADLELDQRHDWLNFGLLATRRPETYGALLDPAGT